MVIRYTENATEYEIRPYTACALEQTSDSVGVCQASIVYENNLTDYTVYQGWLSQVHDTRAHAQLTITPTAHTDHGSLSN